MLIFHENFKVLTQTRKGSEHILFIFSILKIFWEKTKFWSEKISVKKKLGQTIFGEMFIGKNIFW